MNNEYDTSDLREAYIASLEKRKKDALVAIIICVSAIIIAMTGIWFGHKRTVDSLEVYNVTDYQVFVRDFTDECNVYNYEQPDFDYFEVIAAQQGFSWEGGK